MKFETEPSFIPTPLQYRPNHLNRLHYKKSGRIRSRTARHLHSEDSYIVPNPLNIARFFSVGYNKILKKTGRFCYAES